MNIIPKLTLGTAQFGMNYGITNNVGKIDNKEISKILQKAFKLGITFIDTAQAYGQSEEIIGKYLPLNNNLKIITKINLRKDLKEEIFGELYLEQVLNKSLKNLKSKSLYCLHIHDITYLNEVDIKKILQNAQKLKEKKFIQKIGVSIYRPDDIKKLPLFLLDIIQVPLSIYNQEFSIDGTIENLKRNNVSVHVRSIFLQGLILTPSKNWPKNISNKFCIHHKNCEALFMKHKVSLLEAALYYHYINLKVESIVFGITSLKDLVEITDSWENLKSKKDYLSKIDYQSLHWVNKEDLDPRNW